MKEVRSEFVFTRQDEARLLSQRGRGDVQREKEDLEMACRSGMGSGSKAGGVKWGGAGEGGVCFKYVPPVWNQFVLKVPYIFLFRPAGGAGVIIFSCTG